MYKYTTNSNDKTGIDYYYVRDSPPRFSPSSSSKAREIPANGTECERREEDKEERDPFPARVPPPRYSHYSVHVRVYVRGAAVRIEGGRGFE